MVDLQSISITIAALSFAAGIVYHMLNLRDVRRARQASLFMEFYSIYSNRKVLDSAFDVLSWDYKDLDDFESKYGKPYNLSKWRAIANFFEGIGVLVDRSLIKLDIVHDLLRYGIIDFWTKFESLIKEQRIRDKTPGYLAYYEDMYRKIVKLRRKKA